MWSQPTDWNLGEITKEAQFPNESCWESSKGTWVKQENLQHMVWNIVDITRTKTDGAVKMVSQWSRCENLWCGFIYQNEGLVENTYQYGMVHETELSRDGLIWKAVSNYRNSSKNIDRLTGRAVRELVLIHPVDEIQIMEELVNVATTCSIVSYVDRIRCQ